MRIAVTTLLSAILLATPAFAHDHYRIIGTVTKITADEIAVKQNKDNAVVEMDHDKKTAVVLLNKKPGAISDVKVGTTVVIDGYGDDIFDLLALEIRIVPPIAPAKKPPLD